MHGSVQAHDDLCAEIDDLLSCGRTLAADTYLREVLLPRALAEATSPLECARGHALAVRLQFDDAGVHLHPGMFEAVSSADPITITPNGCSFWYAADGCQNHICSRAVSITFQPRDDIVAQWLELTAVVAPSINAIIESHAVSEVKDALIDEIQRWNGNFPLSRIVIVTTPEGLLAMDIMRCGATVLVAPNGTTVLVVRDATAVALGHVLGPQ